MRVAPKGRGASGELELGLEETDGGGGCHSQQERTDPRMDEGAAKARLQRGLNVIPRSLELSLVFEDPGTDVVFL